MAQVASDQLELFVSGCILAFVYWRTNNLFCAIGLHGVMNLPTTVLAWHDLGRIAAPTPVVLALGMALAVAWPVWEQEQ